MNDDESLSEEDRALFRAVMRSVKPLRDNHPPPQARNNQPLTILPDEPLAKTPSNADYALSNYCTEEVLAEDILSFKHANLPIKRWRQLKSARIPLEARLDLHGLSLDDAQTRLVSFIDQQLLKHKRCVLVIHGKGGRHGEPPILKNHVNTWLRQLPQVLAFHSALNRHGGSGALYVLLKKVTST